MSDAGWRAYSDPHTVTLRRKALRPFSFQDSTYVSPDDWVCVPQGRLMRDSRLFVNPDTFDGHRYISKESPVPAYSSSKYTVLSPDFPFWGLGKHAW